MTEAGFVAHASRRMVEGLLSFRPEAVAASMGDVLAERDPRRGRRRRGTGGLLLAL